MSLLNKLLHFVIFTSNKYKIDESHGLKHSMDVLQYAFNIFNAEKINYPEILNHERIIYISAIVHDMCDKKYMSEMEGINNIEEFLKTKNQFIKFPNSFCSSTCSGTYNSAHKKFGTRRSKLEKWLEEKLIMSYPSLEFHFNRKDTIYAELDIYIPTLNLAFELNGIFHYEPIFGDKKLQSTQTNDKRKFHLF